ncbi:hypothetical protein [Butyrivibrio fibrisolvens]|uniref:hypothetical protein n=1 Tax=Butyrivibrio fibrisolvens TaxID=831 RepID=UPI00041C72B5|nr:hypothetical protein [Butyrivibrio fibrisolvens]
MIIALEETKNRTTDIIILPKNERDYEMPKRVAMMSGQSVPWNNNEVAKDWFHI